MLLVCVCLSVVPALCSDSKMPWSKWMPGIAACCEHSQEKRAQTAALQKLVLKNAVL